MFGKQKNPMQTMIGGMAKLSLITRRNLFYDDLIKKNDEVSEVIGQQLQIKQLYHNLCLLDQKQKQELFLVMRFQRIAVIDPAQTLNVNIASGASNPFGDIAKPYFARKGVAEALEKTSLTTQKSRYTW